MILVLAMIMVGCLLLVFTTHLLNRLDGEEIFPFWLCSFACMLFGMLGIAAFLPLVGNSDGMAFATAMSSALAALGASGIFKTLPPL